MDYRKRFVVRPGSAIQLGKVDPSSTGTEQSRQKAEQETEQHVERMRRLQYLLFAEGRRSLLIVIQAMDAGGKDGVIRHLFTGMNPQGTAVASFKQPSRQELAHDFLWRAHLRTPAHGEVVIFNRSHYEDVLVVRVHKMVPKAVWSRRFRLINDFERLLGQGGTRILKLYLHIDQDEQLARFKRRLDDPMRRWKISENDYTERALWPEYLRAYEDVFEQTGTEVAPWYVIPSNHKWFRDLAVSAIVSDTLQEMGLKVPPPLVDLDQIRRKYHAAQRQSEQLRKRLAI